MNNKLMNSIKEFGILTIVGLVFFIIGIKTIYDIRKKEKNCTSKTYGEIKDVVKHRLKHTDYDYSSEWHPVVEYKVDEHLYLKELKNGNFQSKYKIGQKIEVYYNPNDFDEWYIVGDNLQKKLALFFVIIGIIFLIVAIISISKVIIL